MTIICSFCETEECAKGRARCRMWNFAKLIESVPPRATVDVPAKHGMSASLLIAALVAKANQARARII
jgi:hypothetical protein